MFYTSFSSVADVGGVTGGGVGRATSAGGWGWWTVSRGSVGGTDEMVSTWSSCVAGFEGELQGVSGSDTKGEEDEEWEERLE